MVWTFGRTFTVRQDAEEGKGLKDTLAWKRTRTMVVSLQVPLKAGADVTG